MRFVWSFFPLFLLGCRGSEINGETMEFEQISRGSISEPTFIPAIFLVILGFLTFIFIFPATVGLHHGSLVVSQFTGLILIAFSLLHYFAGGPLDISIAMAIAGIIGVVLPMSFSNHSSKNKKAEEDEEEETDEEDG